MAQTRSRSGGKMDAHGDATISSEAATDGKARRKKSPPRVSAILPLLLGCLAPIPILLASMDKVPGQTRPASKTPVLYEFNKLFKLCGMAPHCRFAARLGTCLASPTLGTAPVHAPRV